MRGIGRVLGRNDLASSLIRTTPFSSASGRGRGALPPPPPNNAIGKSTKDEEQQEEEAHLPSGRGHGALSQASPRQPSKVTGVQGRGRGFSGPKQDDKPSDVSPPSPFKAWQPDWQPSSVSGIGRGRAVSPGRPPVTEYDRSKASDKASEPASQGTRVAGKPIFLKRGETVRPDESSTPSSDEATAPDVRPFEAMPRRTITPPPMDFTPSLPGYGRGKPLSPSQVPQPQQPRIGINEENRHLRPAKRPLRRTDSGQPSKPAAAGTAAKLVGEEAVKQALGILAKRAEETGFTEGPPGGRGGGRGRGRGRGRGFGRGRGRGDRRMGRYAEEKTSAVDDTGDLFLGDDADGERLVKRIGEENWNKISEIIDGVSGDLLPCPAEEVYKDALDINFSLEFEPEYAMEVFGTNPDIDDTPPIPLREFMMKMKPLLVAAEGIRNEEEWQVLLEEAMERAPYLRELVRCYSGPGRMTARQEIKELESIASTLPSNVHPSIKNFTDRALISLQSNPGWGFDKKFQFMHKVVGEVNQYHQAKQK